MMMFSWSMFYGVFQESGTTASTGSVLNSDQPADVICFFVLWFRQLTPVRDSHRSIKHRFPGLCSVNKCLKHLGIGPELLIDRRRQSQKRAEASAADAGASRAAARSIPPESAQTRRAA